MPRHWPKYELTQTECISVVIRSVQHTCPALYPHQCSASLEAQTSPPSLSEMFWKVQACWCEFLTCYSSSWKPKINKKRNMCCTSWIGQSDKTEADKEKKWKKSEGSRKYVKKKPKKKTTQPSIIILPEQPHKTRGLSHLCKLTDHHRDDESLRSRTTWTHPCSFLPPWDGVLQQASCAGFDLERLDGHTEWNDTANTQVWLGAQWRTQVPLGYTAHIPETQRGVWGHYKYIYVWPWPGGEETSSAWWMAIHPSNSRTFQTTQTVYSVYCRPLHEHYWPVLAVRNNGAPQPQMLLKERWNHKQPLQLTRKIKALTQHPLLHAKTITTTVQTSEMGCELGLRTHKRRNSHLPS